MKVDLVAIDNWSCDTESIHLPSMDWTYGVTGFYSGQTSYLNMEVLTFAKDKIMRFY